MPLTEPLVAPGRHDDGPATPAPVPARDGADRDEGAADVLLERIGLVVGLVIVLVEAALTIGRRSMWHDEAYTLAAVNDLGLSLSSTHGTMGLYYVGLWPWAQVSTAAWWLRLPSVLLALATLLVVRSIGRRIGGPRLAAVAVPLAALVPVFVHKATEARSYALVTFLVALAWWLVLPGTGPDDPRAERRRGVGLVAVGIAGTLAHGLFFVHLVPLVGLAILLPRPRAAVVRTGGAVAASAAVAWGLRSGGASDVGVTFTGGLGEWASTTAGAYVAGPPLVQAAVVAMAALGTWVCLRRVLRADDAGDRARWAAPVLWMLGPVVALSVVSIAFPMNHPRYLAAITPGMALTLAAAVVAAGRRVATDAGRPPRAVTVAVAVPLLVAMAWAVVTTPNPDGQDWRAAARTVAAEARPGDALLFANLGDDEPEQHRPPFEAAWAEVGSATAPVVISSRRPLGSVRRYEADGRTPAEMADAARDLDRVWVVDGGTGASVGADRILADPGFDGLVLVERWERDDGIALSLYEWR